MNIKKTFRKLLSAGKHGVVHFEKYKVSHNATARVCKSCLNANHPSICRWCVGGSNWMKKT